MKMQTTQLGIIITPIGFKTMKHEDFYNEYKQLQAKEIAELRRCLEAHGDEYDWDAPEHEDECRPIICVMSYMRERLTENEKLLISQAVCDLESGNHLLRERTVEQKKMISEVCIAIDTDERKRDDRQTLIVEQVKMCTDPDYKPQN